MKLLLTIFSVLLLSSCASSKNINYTASTPASPSVRSFLGISLTDSIDFIRWNLTINDRHYSLECNYGIGKPNTNGFINGGEKILITGELIKKANFYQLVNKQQSLRLLELNTNLLHITDEDNNLLIGNGGWSYVLNNKAPSAKDLVTITAKPFEIKDSIELQGRTPCGVPGIVEKGDLCYKLKWGLKFYAGSAKDAGIFLAKGSPWYKQGGRRGNWKMVIRKDGGIVYQLLDEKGNPFVNLLKLDEGVMIFTDEKGNLLVGDHDFSYTLNRIK